MIKLLKLFTIIVLTYHLLIFYILENELNKSFIQVRYCLCRSNPITNTYYICSTNKIQKYITNMFLSNDILQTFNNNNPLYDIYTFFIPIKFVHDNSRMCF